MFLLIYKLIYILVKFQSSMLTVHGRPRINRVDSETSVLQFKDVLNIFFLKKLIAEEFNIYQLFRRIENYGVSLSYFDNIFPMKFWLVYFELKCQRVYYFCYGKGNVEKIMND